MKSEQPYTKLALIYDRLMDHVDYHQWSSYVLKLIHQSSRDISSLIDLSCGTGNLLFYLEQEINNVYGCDNSKEMIHEARKKKIPDTNNLFINDIRSLAIKDCSFDCALVLYDSLNYLVDEKSLVNSLIEIHRILTQGGIFIFDVVSENHCFENYANFYESEYWKDEGYSRHSFYDSENKYQFNEFRIVIKGEAFFEKHQQRIYGIDHLKSTLCENSFKIMGIYNDFSNDDSLNDSGRIHFLCRKV
jgi:SAM-dependent methyltransferase